MHIGPPYECTRPKDLAFEQIVQPRDVDSVSPGEVSHGRSLTSFDDMVGALAILYEVEHDVSLMDRFPLIRRRYPNRAHRSARRDHFGFDGRVLHARLLSALSAGRKTGVVTYKCWEDARGGFKLWAIAGKVGVSVESEREGVGLAADVASQYPVRGVVKVAHESVLCQIHQTTW